MSHLCPWRWRLGVVVVGPKPKLWPRPKPGFWDLDTLGHKTKASKEVLNRVSVKDVVLDAVVALMQQLPVLGDEVSDGPGSKLLVELVLHVVDQHLNVGVDPHLLLHFLGHSNPLFNGVVTWYVNHLEQLPFFPLNLKELIDHLSLWLVPAAWTWPLIIGVSLSARKR